MDFLTSQEIADRCRELREAQGLTQEEFGEILGLNQASVSKIENGQRAISARETLLLEAQFGIPSTSFIIRESRAPAAVMRTETPRVEASLSVFREAIDDFYGVEAMAGDIH